MMRDKIRNMKVNDAEELAPKPEDSDA